MWLAFGLVLLSLLAVVLILRREAVRIAVESRKARHRVEAARDEMRTLIHNADLLDRRGGDYQIDSTFETATGTTQIQLRKSRAAALAAAAALLPAALLLVLIFFAAS